MSWIVKIGVADENVSRLLIAIVDLDWEQFYVYPEPAQQETESRSKRHPKSVEGLRVKGEGEQ